MTTSAASAFPEFARLADDYFQKLELLIVAQDLIDKDGNRVACDAALCHLEAADQLLLMDAFVEAQTVGFAFCELHVVLGALKSAMPALRKLNDGFALRHTFGEQADDLVSHLRSHINTDVIAWLDPQLRLIYDLAYAQFLPLDDSVGHKARTAENPAIRFVRARKAAFVRALHARGFSKTVIIGALAALELNWRDGEERDAKLAAAKTYVLSEAVAWEVHQADGCAPDQADGGAVAHRLSDAALLPHRLRKQIDEQVPAKPEWADASLSRYRTWSPPDFPPSLSDSIAKLTKPKKTARKAAKAGSRRSKRGA